MSPDNKHILIICSGLDTPGGIERSIVNTANLFNEKGSPVTILIFSNCNKSFYPINIGITVLSLPLNFGVTRAGNILTRKLFLFKDLKKLKATIKDIAPDIIITTDYIFSITARLVCPKRIKLISWEHHHYNHLEKSFFWKVLFRLYYPKIDCIVVLNIDEAFFFNSIGCITEVVPNFIYFKNIKENVSNTKQILSIGWLSHTKGSDRIYEVASIVFSEYPEWTWSIIGEGQWENKLLLPQIEVSAPVSPDIQEKYYQSSMYVLLSRVECFPMVLLEAMHSGIPCIAFDCPTGPKHIIRHNEDGILVQPGNVEEMARAIVDLICNEEKRKKLGQKAAANIQRYNADTIHNLWKKVLFDQNPS